VSLSSGKATPSRDASFRDAAGSSTLIPTIVTPRAANAADSLASSPSWLRHHGHQKPR
jgi:hypothetical protein